VICSYQLLWSQLPMLRLPGFRKKHENIWDNNTHSKEYQKLVPKSKNWAWKTLFDVVTGGVKMWFHDSNPKKPHAPLCAKKNCTWIKMCQNLWP
jgi:hypothetical protein